MITAGHGFAKNVGTDSYTLGWISRGPSGSLISFQPQWPRQPLEKGEVQKKENKPWDFEELLHPKRDLRKHPSFLNLLFTPRGAQRNSWVVYVFCLCAFSFITFITSEIWRCKLKNEVRLFCLGTLEKAYWISCDQLLLDCFLPSARGSLCNQKWIREREQQISFAQVSKERKIIIVLLSWGTVEAEKYMIKT